MFYNTEYHCDPAYFPEHKDIFRSKQFSIRETLTLPCEKPDIEEILDVRACPRICGWKVIKSPGPTGKKVVITGQLEQTILYVADVPSQSVHAAHFTVPFCEFINIRSDCFLNHDHGNEPHILLEYLCAQSCGPRSISKCAVLFVWFPKETDYCPPHPKPGPPPRPWPTPKPYPPPHHRPYSSCKDYNNGDFSKDCSARKSRYYYYT